MPVRSLLAMSALAATFAVVAPASAAETIYLKLDGVEGEATTKEGAKMHAVTAASFKVSMPMSAGPSGTTNRSGRPVFSDITVKLPGLEPKTTPTLFQKTAAGAHIKTGELHYFRSDSSGASVEFYRIDLEDLIITSLDVSNDEETGKAVRTVTFNFRKVKHTGIVPKMGGPGSGNVVGGWDLEKNVKQ